MKHVSPLLRWLRHPERGRPPWYMRIPEPRGVRIFYALIYAALMLAGVMVLVDPPVSVEGELGAMLTSIWGWFLATGSAVGLVAVLTPYWWVERAGILLAVSGAAVYATVIIYLQFIQTGNRVVQLCFVAVTILSLILRWVRIRGALIEPGR